MPTYGEKWRDKTNKNSACDQGHVPRSYPTPYLRLDSQGEISSVDHNCQGGRTHFDLTTSEMNGNLVSMKNLLTNRVLGVKGLCTNNLTGSKMTTDCNANIVDRITESLPACFPLNTMNSSNNFVPPNCGFRRWNWTGPSMMNCGTFGQFGAFPCHQFSNSFNAPYRHSGPGKAGLFCSPDVKLSHWRQRPPKCDRSYRGHSPKHHKQEHVKNDKKLFKSEQSTSKCSKMDHVETPNSLPLSEIEHTDDKSVSRQLKTISQVSESKSVDLTSKVDASITCQVQVEPVSLNHKADMTDFDKLFYGKCTTSENVPKENSKSDCKMSDSSRISQDMQNVMTFNVTSSCKNDKNRAQETDSRDSANESNHKPFHASSENGKCESNIQVLFVRKNWKKGRPSSSKQRRRKQQKAKSAGSCSGGVENLNQGSTNGGKTDTSDYANPKSHHTRKSEEKNNRRSATVSFILGLAQSPPSPTVPNGRSTNSSFVVSFSDDEGEDEEDSEWDTDFSIAADFAQCDLFNFLPNNNVSSSPLNLEVHISSLPNRQDKTIDDINSAWNVQISLKEDSCKQIRKTKKVHFPEEKKLAVVHPMVAWAYAYRSARKGHWENFVRDRDRFKRRIQELECVLVPVLDLKHRQYIYEQRFKDPESN